MKIDSIFQNENEQTLKRIRRELYFLYAKDLEAGLFTDELITKIKHYVARRIKEEEQKMRWFSVVWPMDNVEQEFDVSVSVYTKSERQMTIRMNLTLVKAEQH